MQLTKYTLICSIAAILFSANSFAMMKAPKDLRGIECHQYCKNETHKCSTKEDSLLRKMLGKGKEGCLKAGEKCSQDCDKRN